MSEKKKEAELNTQPAESSDNFEFVTETIKKRPVNVRKIVKKIVFTLLLAVIFGVVASFVFAYLYPVIKERLYPDDGTVAVSIKTPTEDDLDDDISDSEGEKTEWKEVEEFEKIDAVEVDADGNVGNISENNKPTDENADSSSDADNTAEAAGKEDGVVVNNIVETIEKELEVDDYRNLLTKISEVAFDTQKSLVTVSSISSDTDWFNNSYESNKSTIGLIFADNGKELLILSPTTGFKNIVNVRVTFVDGQTYPARIKKSDSNTGLCVLGVELEKISDSTMNQIERAEFGGLSTSAVGVPVIAVGAPYGTSGSYAIGQITSNSIVIDKTDTNVGIIATNIYGSSTASGVLINYNGRIVGILCHEDMAGDMPNLLHAYSITDITDTVEKLSNGQGLAKLGILGTDVTEEANYKLKVPYGTYVKEVVPDSPAMDVGFRNGDVIVKVGTTDIKTFNDFQVAMLKCHPGDIVVITIMRPGREEYTEVTYEVTLEAL